MLSFLLDKEGSAFADAAVARLERDERERDRYLLLPGETEAADILLYLRAVSDGYVIFDSADVTKKIEGPVVVEAVRNADFKNEIAILQELRQSKSLPDYSKGRPGAQALAKEFPDAFGLSKHYFAGQSGLLDLAPGADKEEFKWVESQDQPLKRTALFEEHCKLTRKDFIVPLLYC